VRCCSGSGGRSSIKSPPKGGAGVSGARRRARYCRGRTVQLLHLYAAEFPPKPPVRGAAVELRPASPCEREGASATGHGFLGRFRLSFVIAVAAIIGAKGLGWPWYILGLLWLGLTNTSPSRLQARQTEKSSVSRLPNELASLRFYLAQASIFGCLEFGSSTC
jgi:hypothetical protein